jgi:hypothetical protein
MRAVFARMMRHLAPGEPRGHTSDLDRRPAAATDRAAEPQSVPRHVAAAANDQGSQVSVALVVTSVARNRQPHARLQAWSWASGAHRGPALTMDTVPPLVAPSCMLARGGPPPPQAAFALSLPQRRIASACQIHSTITAPTIEEMMPAPNDTPYDP